MGHIIVNEPYRVIESTDSGSAEGRSGGQILKQQVLLEREGEGRARWGFRARSSGCAGAASEPLVKMQRKPRPTDTESDGKAGSEEMRYPIIATAAERA
jgi:hypothetical protein